jgi:hypothetical protein
MECVYVAGPYRANSEHELVINIRKAEAVAQEVWKAGYVAICPHKNTAYFGGICEDKMWLDGGLELLDRSDAMILVEKWEKSSGTIEEISFAKKNKIPIFNSIEELKEAKVEKRVVSRPVVLGLM